eukprot:g15086.t1
MERDSLAAACEELFNTTALTSIRDCNADKGSSSLPKDTQKEQLDYLSRVRRLRKCITEASPRILSDRFDAVFFPLASLLRFYPRAPVFREQVLLEALQAVEECLQKCRQDATFLRDRLTAKGFRGIIELLLPFLEAKAGRRAGSIRHPPSEEVRAATSAALQQLWTAAADAFHQEGSLDIRRLVCGSDFCVLLGYFISLLLQPLLTRCARELRVQNLITLQSLVRAFAPFHSFPEDSPQERGKTDLQSEDLAARAALASFLPGILSTLGAVLLGDFKQGSSVMVAALQLWTLLITILLQDSSLPGARVDTSGVSRQDLQLRLRALVAGAKAEAKDGGAAGAGAAPSQPSGSQGAAEALKVCRDEAWLAVALPRVNILCRKIYGLPAGEESRGWRVRLQLALSAAVLLRHCGSVLSPVCPSLVDCLVAGTEDDMAEVRQAASKELLRLQDLQILGWQDLQSSLQESLAGKLSGLPRLLQGGVASAAASLRLLQECIGYTKLMSPKQTSMQDQAKDGAAFLPTNRLADVWLAAFDRMSSVLLLALQVSKERSGVLQQRKSEPFAELPPRAAIQAAVNEDSNGDLAEWKGKHGWRGYTVVDLLQVQPGASQAEDIQRLLKALPRVTARGHGLTRLPAFMDLWLDRLAALPTKGPLFPAAVLAINQILLGARDLQQQAGCSSGISALEPHVVRLLQEYTRPERWDCRDPVLEGLLVKGVGDAAEVLGQARLGEQLLTTLAPLLASLGRQDLLVRTAAYTTLARMAQLGGFASSAGDGVGELVAAHGDYLVDQVAAKLRRLRHDRQRARQIPAGENNLGRCQQRASLKAGGFLSGEQADVTGQLKFAVVSPKTSELDVRSARTKASGGKVDAARQSGGGQTFLPRLLEALLLHSGAGSTLLPQLGDLLNSVLEELADIGVEAQDIQDDGHSSIISLANLRLLLAVTVAAGRLDLPAHLPCTAPDNEHMPAVSTAAGPAAVADRLVEALRTQAEMADVRSPLYRFQKLQRASSGDLKDVETESGSEAREFFTSHLQQKEQAEADGEREDAHACTEEEQDPPTVYLQVARILQTCRHLMAAPNLKQRHLVLLIVAQAVRVLRPFPKVLLPSVALVWPALRKRLEEMYAGGSCSERSHDTGSKLAVTPCSELSSREEDSIGKAVFLETVAVFAKLAHACPRFLAGRFVKELWPLLQRALNLEYATTERLRALSGMESIEDSSAFQVQLLLLRALRSLVSEPELVPAGVQASRLVRAITRQASPYLHQSEHRTLRVAAAQLFHQLAVSVDPDCVWWTLARLASKVVFSQYSADSLTSTISADERELENKKRSSASASPADAAPWVFCLSSGALTVFPPLSQDCKQTVQGIVMLCASDRTMDREVPSSLSCLPHGFRRRTLGQKSALKPAAQKHGHF